MKQKIIGTLGTILGVILMTAHLTHAPLWLVGIFGFGMSFMHNLVLVQIIGVSITLTSLALLLKKLNMNNQTILIAVIALLIGGISGYGIAGKDKPYEQRGHNEEAVEHIPMGAHHMRDGTMMGDADTDMGQMDHMMVSSERDFIEGMIPHHQEAVDTAKEVIERGGSTPEIKQLVEDIVVAQEAEIIEMKQWYQDWYDEPYADIGEYMPMMRELENLSGTELDQVFLEDMIGHHMGAIMMARSVQPYIKHDEIAGLTREIVSTQSAEITEMRQMLQSL